LFVVLVVKTITIVLDKNTKKLSFKFKSLIKEKSEEYNLDQIKQIELRQDYIPNSKGRGAYAYELFFIFDNGEEVPLNSYSSSIVLVLGKQIIPEKSMGARIANFLNIPFQERRPPTITETLSTIQEVVQKEIEKNKNRKEQDG